MTYTPMGLYWVYRLTTEWMTTKHTPGPWNIETEQTDDGDFLIRSSGGSIGAVFPRLDGYENARLIAAAPELLEALKECRLAMNHHGITGYPAQFMADAAIAKATGK